MSRTNVLGGSHEEGDLVGGGFGIGGMWVEELDEGGQCSGGCLFGVARC